MHRRDKSKILNFRFNNKVYKIDIRITLNFLKCYEENRYKLSDKELIKKCIVNSNNEISGIISELNKNQLLYILRAYARFNGLSDSEIKSYTQFINLIDRKIEDIIKPFSSAAESISSFQESIVRSIAPLQESIDKVVAPFQESMREYIIPLQNSMKEFITPLQNSIAKTVEPIGEYLSSLNDVFKDVVNAFNNIKRDDNAYEKILIDNGYPLIDIPVEEKQTICILRNSEDIRLIIDRSMLRSYTDSKVKIIFNSWREKTILCKRIHLIEDAIYAYENEKYSLSIPIFLSQVEGLIAEFYDHKGRMNGSIYKSYIKRTLNMDKDEKEYKDKIMNAFFFKEILANFEHGDEISKFSRHAILHGGDVNYGTKINNLKIIISFDIILDQLSEAEKEYVEGI